MNEWMSSEKAEVVSSGKLKCKTEKLKSGTKQLFFCFLESAADATVASDGGGDDLCSSWRAVQYLITKKEEKEVFSR